MAEDPDLAEEMPPDGGLLVTFLDGQTEWFPFDQVDAHGPYGQFWKVNGSGLVVLIPLFSVKFLTIKQNSDDYVMQEQLRRMMTDE